LIGDERLCHLLFIHITNETHSFYSTEIPDGAVVLICLTPHMERTGRAAASLPSMAAVPTMFRRQRY